MNDSRSAATLLDALLAPPLEQALSEMEGNAPLLPRMARYHLGMVDATGAPTDLETRKLVQGKRMRPLLAVLSCLAVGGRAGDAAPIAAAIELLHNFTLVHDDIQDRSPNRRHRATVWRIWGDAQAINAGDGIFSAAHLAVLQTPHDMLPAESLFTLTAEFNRMTIAIVRGQVLDLGFEGRGDVTPDDYLGMISGKTAAIVRYAAWAGSIVGGAPEEVSDRFARMGLALGIGFQIQDDLLGIWGTSEETGKEVADDVRRRKQSLPVLLLRSQANAEDTELLDRLYANDEIDEPGIARVLQLLDAYDIQRQVVAKVEEAHDEASQILAEVAGGTSNPGLDGIQELITRMRVRLS
ncbi:MAG TPA: polyprenyl synthetase family protein [Thermomicrobiales bacterium]|nr:polyprenyl synthetase family protein [Thermomicrobiales bacterium]